MYPTPLVPAWGTFRLVTMKGGAMVKVKSANAFFRALLTPLYLAAISLDVVS
eukprot:GDKH01025762.1.p4 GENE.GDKH01025762.1~~GDKH01025762.1.p4  ORF type:complete len:52 (+),score=1.90 GDKH01025762.1:103-258(+)